MLLLELSSILASSASETDTVLISFFLFMFTVPALRPPLPAGLVKSLVNLFPCLFLGDS